MSWEIFCVPTNCDRERAGRTRGSLGQGPSPASHQPCAAPTHFLIANLELEMNVNPIRINELKFPNRKYFAIFRVGLRHLVTNPLAGAFLIETPRLESLATPTKLWPNPDSNRDKSGGLSSAFRGATSHATLTLRAPQSNLPASCFVRALAGEHS
jgi:hypothetical protein